MDTSEQLDRPKSKGTSVDQMVFRIAGLLVLVSLVLSQVHSIYWLWLTAFVGANMFQASFTGFCPLAKVLAKLGIPSGMAFPPPRSKSL